MRSFFLLTLALVLTACASVGDSIGGAYVSIETLAETIHLECGNVEPGAPCVDSSMLDRGDVDSMKVDLQRAKNAVDQANSLYDLGDNAGAASRLEMVQLILQSLRTSLEIRGVQ